MKKHLLSVVALASILVLAGCNTNKTSSSSPAVSSSSPKISSSTTTTVAVTGVTLDKTTAELVVGGTVTLTATVAPTTATDKTVTWASSDATVASVADGVVTAVKVGTANITATCGTKVATCAVTVKSAMPSPTKTTIAALNALTADDTTHLYEVTGILEDKIATDKYGNGYLTDATTGASIKIYGSTTTASAITFTDNALGFTNPKDAVTTLADYANGESVTLHCIYKYYNSTPEIMGIMTAHAATTNKYSITKETATNGTFTVDKETATYGETVTITTTPNEGYSVDTVKVNHNYANESATTVTADSSYTFTVTCVNSITVTFKAAETNSLILTSSNIISTQSAYGNYDSTVGGVTIKAMGCADYGNGIQMRYKNSVASAVYNTSATPKAIKNIVFTFGKSQSATAELTYVAFGAASLADTTTGAAVTYDGTEHTYTITPDAATYTFFKFGHTTTSGTVYFESVVINYVTA